MDNDLFWKLLKPNHLKAEMFCRKLVGNRDDGDDLYQETLLMAMRRFDKLKDYSAFRPWLFRIIVNCFKNRYRKPWWRRRATLTPEIMEAAGTHDPRGSYDSRRWLERAMMVLSPEDKAMIVLYEIEGQTVAELASIFKKPEGTIKARLWRARRKMREKLERFLPERNAKADVNNNVGGKYALQRSDSTDK